MTDPHFSTSRHTLKTVEKAFKALVMSNVEKAINRNFARAEADAIEDGRFLFTHMRPTSDS